MPQNIQVAVKDLKLDLTNYRTVPQSDEASAVAAMVLISPDRFWALMDSMIDTGYLPTDNIIVLDTGTEKIVKEGNRRIAVLKLISGDIVSPDVTIPTSTQNKIASLSATWKTDNTMVPCTIYPVTESVIVDRIVTLAHGKAEKAGRDQWSAVARARHNRDVNGENEVALDLLEKYLTHGRNLTSDQKERWAGDYPLTNLDEAMKKIAPRVGVLNAPELASKYPVIGHRDALESIIKDIGVGIIKVTTLRTSSRDFADNYGLPPVPVKSGNVPVTGTAPVTGTSPSTGTTPTTGTPVSTGATTSTTVKKPVAIPLNDPRSVKRLLQGLQIKGNNRAKVATLRNEAVTLKLTEHPFAFCFLLRSMFEISAKAYCDDQIGTATPLASVKPDGKDKVLKDLLKEIAQHLINSTTNAETIKTLHGANAEISKSESLLSVTSMNALVHNPNFSVTAADISTVFNNIFPLLKAMNE